MINEMLDERWTWELAWLAVHLAHHNMPCERSNLSWENDDIWWPYETSQAVTGTITTQKTLRWTLGSHDGDPSLHLFFCRTLVHWYTGLFADQYNDESLLSVAVRFRVEQGPCRRGDESLLPMRKIQAGIRIRFHKFVNLQTGPLA